MSDITITNSRGGGGVSAVIRTCGAELRSLIVSGRELMWAGDPAFWGKTSPLLFPVIGFLRGETAVFDGMSVPLGKHGFARDMEFSVEQNDSFATFAITHTEQTREHFPYKFALALTYTLTGAGVSVDYTVTNKDVRPMPYCIGAHPAIACAVDDSRLVFEKAETVNGPVMDVPSGLWNAENRILRLSNSREFPLSYPLFDNDCVYFDKLSSASVLLTSKSADDADDAAGVRVRWSGFNSLGVWTPAGKNAPFVCIEPWRGTNDYTDEYGEFSRKRDVDVLPPGDHRVYNMTIELAG